MLNWNVAIFVKSKKNVSGGVVVDSVPNDIADARRLDYEQNVQDAIAILPKLQTGLDVNVRFTGVSLVSNFNLLTRLAFNLDVVLFRCFHFKG